MRAMGIMRDAEIAARQAAAGIKPPRPGEAKLLEQMSDAAFALIKVIELERSGIRDGDGYWSGSDAMGATARDLVAIIEKYERRVREEWEATVPVGSDDVPF
jgi:hypothetical protein